MAKSHPEDISRGYVDTQRVIADVAKDRRGSGGQDGLEVGNVVERGCNNLIARAYAGYKQSKMQRRVPGAPRGCVGSHARQLDGASGEIRVDERRVHIVLAAHGARVAEALGDEVDGADDVAVGFGGFVDPAVVKSASAKAVA